MNLKIARAAAGILLAFAAYHSIRLGWADWQWRKENTTALNRAIAADPDNAEYLAAAGRLTEAVSLNPRASAVWIRLGLQQEIAGDATAAEQSLLRAAEVNHKYEPRWTLANFYFRHHRQDEFWRWARAAFEMHFGDQTPLFDLCWALTSNGDRILERAIPDDSALRLQYLSYLTARSHWNAAAILAESLRRTNISLDGTPFGWEILQQPGVTAVAQPGRRGWRFELDGTQPERCELISHIEPVPQSSQLALNTHYQAALTTPEAVVPETGLRWVVTPLDQPGRILAASDPFLAHAERNADLTVSAPAPAVRIALLYEKPSGSMRLEGTLVIDTPEIERQP